MRKVRYIEEKQIMQQFLYQVGHDTGMITYGEAEVRRALESGAVRTLLLSEGLDVLRVTVKCGACGYQEQHTVKAGMMANLEQGLVESLVQRPASPLRQASVGRHRYNLAQLDQQRRS
jgi:peptide subunit release factor 1 (eRF1)